MGLSIHRPRWACAANSQFVKLGIAMWLSVSLASANGAEQTGSAIQPEKTGRSTLRVIKFKDATYNAVGAAVPLEIRMLEDFAETANLDIEWVDVFRSSEALSKLYTGEGDLSVGAVPIDRTSDANLLASAPIGLHHFRVVGRYSEVIESPLELAGMSLAVKLSSPMWSYLDRLRTVIDDLRLQVLPDDLSREETLQMVSDGIYDAVLVTGASRDDITADEPRLKVWFDLTGPEPIRWFAHQSNHALMERVDKFIRRFHTAYHNPNPAARTFADIKKSGILRVITRLDEKNYFLYWGRPSGFEIGYARRFAAKFGLRLDVLVGRDEEEILAWLRDGAGDIVTTRINAQSIRGEPAFDMSRKYRHDASVLITSSRNPIEATPDLANKIIAGYEGSRNLEALVYFAADVSTVIPVDQKVSMAVLLERIEAQVIDAAVISAHHLDAVLSAHYDLVGGMSIPNPYRYRWTLRGADAPLIAAVEQFIQSEYRDETYNLLKRRYVNTKKLPEHVFTDISPFDELIQTYAEKHSFDWRLIAAQMFQESQFDPAAISGAGAIGLMQLMPATATSLGVDNPDDPEAGIRGGVEYLDYLRDRFDEFIPMSERTWLALAAYNTGFDRIRRARNHAGEIGLNPNKWFDNVEVALRKMSRPFGESGRGCRCGQAIVYVRSIRSLYYAYRNLKLADKTPTQRSAPTQNISPSKYRNGTTI